MLPPQDDFPNALGCLGIVAFLAFCLACAAFGAWLGLMLSFLFR